jgi:hypothetical protein
MLINRNEKLVSIPKSTDPIFALKLNATTFSFSNPAVNVLYRDNYSTRFSLGAVNSFTLNVSTTDWCNYYYYWPVLFVYTAAGARISENHYPNPANDIITVETTILNEDELTTISNIEVYDHVGAIQKNVKNQKDGEKYLINTSSLANGIYFIHITYSNGEVSKKRIIINHE